VKGLVISFHESHSQATRFIALLNVVAYGKVRHCFTVNIMDIDKKIRALLAECEDDPPGSASPEMFQRLRNTKSTNEEILLVRASVKTEEARMQSIEAKIFMLQQIVKDLTLKRVETERRLTSYKAIVAPITFIPTEILSEIFVHLMEHPTISRIQWRRVASTISQVNSVWRAVAFDTPRFWSTIVSSRPFRPEIDSPLIKLWLKRAKGFPITFVLQSMGDHGRDEISEVFKTIAPTLHTLIFDFKWPSAAIFQELEEEGIIFPQLRRFKASHSTGSRNVVQLPLPTMMPGLEGISIKRCPAFIINGVLDGQWGRITDFDGPFMVMEDVVEMFSQALSLRRCSFDLAIQGPETPAQDLKHGALQTLAFNVYCPGENVASHLASLPSFTTLKHLKVDIRLSDGAFNSVRLSPFLMHSGASLCYMQLSGAFTENELASCLRSTPRLRFLHLTTYEQNEDDFIKTLAFDPSSPAVPELQVLSLTGKLKFRPMTLWGVVISRNHPLDSKSPSPIRHSLIRPLSHIKLSDHGSPKALKSRFSTIISRLDKEYGVTTHIRDASHHLPLLDAQELLGFKDLDIDASWDWKWGGLHK